MARKLPEWIGKNDDTKIPDRVKDRVFETSGKICHVCKLPIHPTDKWDADHVNALINGGENRESNLAPAHEEGCHPKKTKEDVKIKAKTAAMRKKHSGITKPKSNLAAKPKPSKHSTDVFAGLPRRKMFS